MISKPTTLVIFQEEGQSVEVRLDAQRDTVWLSQRQMADLFETSSDNISLHLKNIFADGELSEVATTEDSSVVRREGKRQVTRKVRHYNLDAIISVGYRISSKRAVQFRQWATRILREHLTQSYTLKRPGQSLEAGGGTGLAGGGIRPGAQGNDDPPHHEYAGTGSMR